MKLSILEIYSRGATNLRYVPERDVICESFQRSEIFFVILIKGCKNFNVGVE